MALYASFSRFDPFRGGVEGHICQKVPIRPFGSNTAPISEN